MLNVLHGTVNANKEPLFLRVYANPDQHTWFLRCSEWKWWRLQIAHCVREHLCGIVGKKRKRLWNCSSVMGPKVEEDLTVAVPHSDVDQRWSMGITKSCPIGNPSFIRNLSLSESVSFQIYLHSYSFQLKIQQNTV